MEKIEDGGPAFPIRERTEHLDGAIVCDEWPGLSRRDYFAAAALPALISRCMGNLDKIEYTAEMMAKSAYEHADAMLKKSAHEGGGGK